MKAIEWDPTNARFKERVTGRVLSATSLPGDMEDGDLWIDTSTEAEAAGRRLEWLLLYQQVITVTEVGP
jgi:hypothetical protein